MTGRIFISHATENAAVADRIVAYLEQRGVPCWISSRDIPPNSIYAEAITQAMREARSCVVLVSEAANGSQAIKRELELASRYSKPFIPIRIDATEPGPGLDYYLNNAQWVDYGRDRERGLDRVVSAYNAGPGAAPAPRAQPRPTKSGNAMLVPILAVGALLLGGLGWFAMTQMSQPPQTAAIEEDDDTPQGVLRGSALVGAYNWDGVACGAGPVITQEASSDLIFTMTGAPTFRHQVVGARRNVDGYAVSVRTRVLEPVDQAGQVYTFRARERGGALEVTTNGNTDEWDRCGDGNIVPALESTAAPATEAVTVADSTWSGVWRADNVPITWIFKPDGRVCGIYDGNEVCHWRWQQDGDAVVFRSEAETWSGRINGNVMSGELRQGHGAELQAIAPVIPFRLERQN